MRLCVNDCYLYLFHKICFIREMSDHNQYCNNFENEELEEKTENIKESDELLIGAVRTYPHLYNHKDPNFKNNLMKENSWKEIALAVNIPGK